MPIVGYSRGRRRRSRGNRDRTHALLGRGSRVRGARVADGGTVGTWPDEIGTADLIQASPPGEAHVPATTGPSSSDGFDGWRGFSRRMAAPVLTWCS